MEHQFGEYGAQACTHAHTDTHTHTKRNIVFLKHKTLKFSNDLGKRYLKSSDERCIKNKL